MLTAIQVFTGFVPFYEHPRDSTVIFKIVEGKRPSRPPAGNLAWVQWGLTDVIWELMEDCWRQDPTSRPTAEDIVARLHSQGRADGRPVGGWGTDMSPAHFRSIANADRSHPSIDDIEIILAEFG